MLNPTLQLRQEVLPVVKEALARSEGKGIKKTLSPRVSQAMSTQRTVPLRQGEPVGAVDRHNLWME